RLIPKLANAFRSCCSVVLPVLPTARRASSYETLASIATHAMPQPFSSSWGTRFISEIFRLGGELDKGAGGRAVVEALAASRAFLGDDLIEMARLHQLRTDRRIRAALAAEAAGIADRVINRDFHGATAGWGERPKPPIWCNR